MRPKSLLCPRVRAYSFIGGAHSAYPELIASGSAAFRLGRNGLVDATATAKDGTDRDAQIEATHAWHIEHEKKNASPLTSFFVQAILRPFGTIEILERENVKMPSAQGPFSPVQRGALASLVPASSWIASSQSTPAAPSSRGPSVGTPPRVPDPRTRDHGRVPVRATRPGGDSWDH